MRKMASALLLVVAVLLFTVTPSLAGGKGGGRGHSGGGHRGGHHGGHGHRHFHSTVVVGGGWWWGYPYWYYPYPYYYPYYYPPQPPEEPPVYIEQSTQATTPRAPAPASYWYYCQSATAYYPNVQSCPEAWIKVAPRTE
jgi:hypothetical protein